MSSTMVSPTLPGSEELISPRIMMTAILSPLPRAPRCTITSRNDGVGSSKRDPPPKVRKADAARMRLIMTLAQSATARNTLRQPSFRFAAMTGQTGGDHRRAQGGKHPWLGSCFFIEHEQRRPPPHERESAPRRQNQGAPWPSAEKQRPGYHPKRTAGRRDALAHQKPLARCPARLGAEASHQRVVSLARERM